MNFPSEGIFDTLAFLVGLAAVAFFLLSYLQKRRKTIIAFNTTARILYIVQYIFLGAFVGAVLDVAGTLASVLAQKKDKPFIKRHLRAVILGADALIVMLGTNDLLEGVKAGEVAARMAAFLAGCAVPQILLVSPPSLQRGAWVPGDDLVEESRELARQYEALAERLGIQFADAGQWDVELAYDGVHFSEAGHARFAEGLASCLEVIL